MIANLSRPLQILDVRIPLTTSIKILEVMLDCQLNFKSYMAKMVFKRLKTALVLKKLKGLKSDVFK
jgi:hypothetical protein